MKKTIRLLDEDGAKRVRWVDPNERLSMLADGQAEIVWRDAAHSHTDGTIKLKKAAPVVDGQAAGIESPSSLTVGDMFRNAAGAIDTKKRREVYRMRENGENVPAAIRSYGKVKMPGEERRRPDENLLGNSVDRSMSRVEQWGEASDSNRAVTVSVDHIVKLKHLDAELLAAL